jgi:hypothetical protein
MEQTLSLHVSAERRAEQSRAAVQSRVVQCSAEQSSAAQRGASWLPSEA